MTSRTTEDWKTFTQRVQESLRQAQAQAVKLSQMNTRLQVTSIVSSAITTLVAGFTAAQGPIVGQGDTGWRVACLIAALFGFVSAVCVGLNQQLKISDRLSANKECLGRLKSLDVSMATGSRSREEISKEYEEIARLYPELVQ